MEGARIPGAKVGRKSRVAEPARNYLSDEWKTKSVWVLKIFIEVGGFSKISNFFLYHEYQS